MKNNPSPGFDRVHGMPEVVTCKQTETASASADFLASSDYHYSFKTGVSPGRAFEAISHVTGWWASQVEGSSKKLNDVFTVRFGTTFARIKIMEMVPGSRIVWLVEDCHMDLLKDKKEWKDSRIIWEISPENNQTRVCMTHLGLVPAKECFMDCTAGWNFYVGESLFNLLTRNTGLPGTGIMATIARDNRIYKGTLFSKEQALTDFRDGYLLIDVKDTNVERVTSSYSIQVLNKENFQKLKGNHYMIIENKPVSGEIQPMEDLQSLSR